MDGEFSRIVYRQRRKRDYILRTKVYSALRKPWMDLYDCNTDGFQDDIQDDLWTPYIREMRTDDSVGIG